MSKVLKNILPVFICLMIIKADAQNISQDTLYLNLIKEGNEFMEQAEPAYELALQKFFSACACDVSEANKQRCEELISSTSKEWTKVSEKQKIDAIGQKEAAVLARKAAEKAAVIIRSFFLAGFSNRATDSEDAFHAAFLARDTIEQYNKLNPDNQVPVPQDVLLTFNNSIYKHKGKVDTFAHHSSIITISFSDSTNRFVTVGRDSTIKVWTTDLKLIFVIKNSKNFFLSADISADGNFLLTTSKDSTTSLWNLSTEVEIPLVGHSAVITKGLFFANGQKALTIDWAGQIKAWDTMGKLINKDLDWISPKPIINITLNPEGSNCLLHTIDGVYLYALDNLNLSPFLLKKEEDELIYDASFSSDGQEVIISSNKGSRIWNLSQKKVIDFSPTKSPAYASVLYSLKEENFMVGTKSGLFNSYKAEDVFSIAHNKPILKLIRSKNGNGNTTIATSINTLLVKSPTLSDTLIKINDGGLIRSTYYTENELVVNQAAILVASKIGKNGYTKFWSLEGKKLMEMEMGDGVEKAMFFKDNIIAYTENGELYSLPFPEKIYRESLSHNIKQSLSPKLEKELKEIE